MTFGIASNFNQIHVWASNICIQSDSRISQVFFFLEFFESKARSAVVAFHSIQHVPEISVSTPSPPEPTTEPNSIRLHARRFVHKSRLTNKNIYCFGILSPTHDDFSSEPLNWVDDLVFSCSPYLHICLPDFTRRLQNFHKIGEHRKHLF